jgi:hypothetical protein
VSRLPHTFDRPRHLHQYAASGCPEVFCANFACEAGAVALLSAVGVVTNTYVSFY